MQLCHAQPALGNSARATVPGPRHTARRAGPAPTCAWAAAGRRCDWAGAQYHPCACNHLAVASRPQHIAAAPILLLLWRGICSLHACTTLCPLLSHLCANLSERALFWLPTHEWEGQAAPHSRAPFRAKLPFTCSPASPYHPLYTGGPGGAPWLRRGYCGRCDHRVPVPQVIGSSESCAAGRGQGAGTSANSLSCMLG